MYVVDIVGQFGGIRLLKCDVSSSGMRLNHRQCIISCTSLVSQLVEPLSPNVNGIESIVSMIVTRWAKAPNLAQLYLRTIYNFLEGAARF